MRSASRPRPSPRRRNERGAGSSRHAGPGMPADAVALSALDAGVEIGAQLPVRDGAAARRVVQRDRHAVARRLAEPDVARDERRQQLLAEAGANLVDDLVREREPGVEEGHHDAGHAERRIQLAAEQRQRVHEQTEPLERVELALDRDEQRLGGDDRVDGEEPEARRRVDEHVVVVRRQRLERVLQPAFAAREIDELDLGARPARCPTGRCRGREPRCAASRRRAIGPGPRRRRCSFRHGCGRRQGPTWRWPEGRCRSGAPSGPSRPAPRRR